MHPHHVPKKQNQTKVAEEGTYQGLWKEGSGERTPIRRKKPEERVIKLQTALEI
jgi:hypothetical protein